MKAKPVMILCGLIFLVVLVGAALWVRGRGFSATEDPSKVEEMLARRVRQLAIPADAKDKKNPLAENAESLEGGKAHWVDHCATCHALDGSGDTMLGRNMYPKAPDMRLPETQKLSDGELFYIIQNGIRFTGMPAWSDHTADDNWRLVLWIRRLPRLTPQEIEQMKAPVESKGKSAGHEHSPGTKPHKH